MDNEEQNKHSLNETFIVLYVFHLTVFSLAAQVFSKKEQKCNLIEGFLSFFRHMKITCYSILHKGGKKFAITFWKNLQRLMV